MKLFRSLLKKSAPPAPETPEAYLARLDPEARRHAIFDPDNATLNDELRQTEIAACELNDTLLEAARHSDSSVIEGAARKRIAALINDGTLSKDGLFSGIEDLQARLAITALCQDEALEEAVLAAVSDEDQRVRLCLEASSARVRRSLAERVSTPDKLKTLAQQLKHKDKTAYRSVKQRLDALRAETKAKEAALEEAESLVSQLQQHAVRPFDRDFEARFDLLRERWAKVEPQASSTQVDSAGEALATCLKTLAAEAAAREASERAAAAEREAVAQFDSLIHDLTERAKILCAAETWSEEDSATLTQWLAHQQQSWRELSAVRQPSKRQHNEQKSAHELVETLEKRNREGGTLNMRCAAAREGGKPELGALRQFLRLVHGVPPLKSLEPVEQAFSQLAEIEGDFAEQQEQREKAERALGGLIRKAERAVDAGKLKPALGMRRAIDEKLQSLSDPADFVQRQLERLDEKLEKLRDWQSYAVIPKKKALVEEMEKLVGAEIPADALATKIKNLQDEWKSLAHGGDQESESLWESFSAAADKAYEPCREHFGELAKERETNLENRKRLVAQLEQFDKEYHWDTPDWKHVETILRTAREELRRYAPVDRSANRSVIAAFDAAMDKIQSRLNEEYSKNKAAKAQLIAQAEKTSQLNELDVAIDSVKRLQGQWKKIGRCQYRDQDALWKQFRVHCDAVFARLDEQRNAARAETDAHIQKARDLVTELQKLNELEGPELLASRAERDRLAEAFEQVEGLPEKVARALQRDFQKAAEHHDRQIGKVINAQSEAVWTQFFATCEQVNEALADQKSDAASERMEAATDWPDGGRQALQKKLAATDSDPEAIREAASVLCIRAEILADRESPESDKALRMAYQVKVLQQGLGAQRERDTGHQLALEWAALPPLSSGDYQSLYARFKASWAASK